jgi:hypothetical protein
MANLARDDALLLAAENCFPNLSQVSLSVGVDAAANANSVPGGPSGALHRSLQSDGAGD